VNLGRAAGCPPGVAQGNQHRSFPNCRNTALLNLGGISLLVTPSFSYPNRIMPTIQAGEGGTQARVWPWRLKRLGDTSHSTQHQVRRSAGLAVQRCVVARELRNGEQMLSTKPTRLPFRSCSIRARISLTNMTGPPSSLCMVPGTDRSGLAIKLSACFSIRVASPQGNMRTL
jgi:hypothetical protein